MFLSDSKQRARIDQRKPSKQVSVGYGGTGVRTLPACLCLHANHFSLARLYSPDQARRWYCSLVAARFVLPLFGL